MTDALVIVGAGIEQIKAYELASKMGFFVIGTDINPEAPAFDNADDKVIASTRDPDATLSALKKYFSLNSSLNFSGIMTIANDVPLTVATVSNEFGLPGISVDSALIASDKVLMKNVFKSNGVKIPLFREIGSSEEIAIAMNEWSGPIVIKPVDGRGARGVLLLTEDTDFEWAYRESMSFSTVKRVMLEAFIDGPQISTESFLIDGSSITPAFSDRNYEDFLSYAPYIIEDGGTLPALLSDEERRLINKLVEDGSAAMGITDGIVKGDIVMGEDGPVIIELAARLSGGYFASDQIPLSTGVDLVKESIRFATGSKVDINDLAVKRTRGVAIRYFFPPEGLVREIHGAEGLGDMAGVVKSEIFIKPGDIQQKVKAHPERAGFVIAVAESRSDAVKMVEAAIDSVEFIID